MENLTRKKERSPPEKVQNLESTFRALPKNKNTNQNRKGDLKL